jgi:hypothetical protein
MFLILYRDSSSLTAAEATSIKRCAGQVTDENRRGGSTDCLTVPPNAVHKPAQRHDEQAVPGTVLQRVLELAAGEAVLCVKEASMV